MGAAESIVAQLAQHDTALQQHDQSVQQQPAQGNAESIVNQISTGQPPAAKQQGPQLVPSPKSSDFDVSLLPGASDPFTRAGYQVTAPLARKLMDAADKLREVENFTPEGRQAHPVQAHLGDIANRIEGFLFGNEEHREAGLGGTVGSPAKTGIVNNPVTSALLPGAEGEPAAAAAIRGGASLVKSGISAVKGAVSGGEAAEEAPGIVKQIFHGEKVAQEPAKAAVRGAIGAEDEATLLEGNKTAVDKHLKEIAAKEKAAYQKMDEAAGFDVKQERSTLANDKYKLKQLGNTEADQTAREKLTASIKDSQARLAEAEKKLGEAGVDVKEADTLHQQRMAGQDFKKALVQNVSQDGESVNVDGLLNASKKLRFSKFGDRLEQFMGKEGAEKYMAELQKAQEMGAHALKTQKLARIIGGIAGPALATGGAVAHSLLSGEH